jgi:non-homologous end joining protein Ku
MVEPRGAGMALFTLLAADEVRASQFGSAEGDLDTEMVAIARAIIKQRTGTFDASTYRDRYQEVSIGAQKGPQIGVQKGPLCGVGTGLSR